MHLHNHESSTFVSKLNLHDDWLCERCEVTLFVELTASSDVATFENVTINVVGGTMLPRLRFQGASLTTIRNVVIHVSDVFAPGRVVNATLDSSGSSVPVTVLDIAGTAPTVQNISVTFTNVTLSIVVTAAATYHQKNLAPATFTPVLAAPFLYLVGNAEGYINSITNISVCVRNCNLSLVVNTFGTTNGTASNTVAMCVIAFTTSGVVQGVSITVLNKSSQTL